MNLSSALSALGVLIGSRSERACTNRLAQVCHRQVWHAARILTRVIFLSTLGSVCYGNICNGSVFRERKRTEHPDGVALRRRTELFSLRPCRAGLSPGNKSSRRVAKKSISRRLAKPFLLL